MNAQIQTPTGEPTTTDYPLRFEIMATWERELTHERDDPEWLKERLRNISVDGDVTVTEFEPAQVRIIVESAVKEMTHSPGVLTSKTLRVFRRYNKATDGDDVNDVPRSIPGLRASHIRKAYQGKERPSGQQYVPPEVWAEAQEKAASLDLEGAGNITPEITLRTLAGEEESHE